jgi:hypothetical protein
VSFMVEPDDKKHFTGPQTPPASSRERARRLGTLLGKSLENLGIARVDFAGRLGIDVKLVDSLVAGTFPLSQIDDDLLALMAYHLNLSEEALRVFRDAEVKLVLPTLPDDQPEDDTAPSRKDIFATLQEVQDEFSADGQDTRRPTPPNLRNINSVLNEIREGEGITPLQEDDGPIQLKPIDKTLKSFLDDEGEEDQ